VVKIEGRLLQSYEVLFHQFFARVARGRRVLSMFVCYLLVCCCTIRVAGHATHGQDALNRLVHEVRSQRGVV
jgi:choline-glycine betaine transporter